MSNKNSHFAGLLICLILLWWPNSSSAESAEELYFEAEASYRELQKKPAKQKYRDNWIACIKKFQAVYRHDPEDPWATAGLYMTARLYQELYRFSGQPSDKQEALDNFERLIKRYPKSGYIHF